MNRKTKYYVLVSYGWIEPTAFTVVDVDKEEIVEYHEAVQTPMNEWKELALKLNDKYLKPPFNCEREEPERNEILKDVGINVRPLNSSVIEKQRNKIMKNGVEKEMEKQNENKYVVATEKDFDENNHYIGETGPEVTIKLNSSLFKNIGKDLSGMFKGVEAKHIEIK